MNNQRDSIPAAMTGIDIRDASSCVPLVPRTAGTPPEKTGHILPVSKKLNPVRRRTAQKDPVFSRDERFTIRHNNAWHLISENYSYKTESYYTILRHELEGRPVCPSSADILDAYVVPVCLERARRAGIPVCPWGISQEYAPLPSILYGLNYFATASDYSVVSDDMEAKETIRHITNKGKYPFCYQKLDDGAEIGSCIAVFGKTAAGCRRSADIAQHVYDLFAIPLVTIVFVQNDERCLLSSLSPTRYSRLSAEERVLLSAYLTHQEFL